ncbi:MAG: PIN domain-containing protein [Acidobacteria bacterium]|nr:PIN domain-containing protein [Acidobacteriota bacterium]
MTSKGHPAFLDTSVVVRYLTGDVPDLAERASRIIDSGEPLILSELVLAETAYVLSSVYQVPRARIVDVLIEFVGRRNVEMLNTSKTRVFEALALCRPSKRVSFVDALLWAEARDRRVSRVYSFDGRFPGDGLHIDPGT